METAAPRTRTDPNQTDAEPWERQHDESPEAWAMFETYRDQDRAARSLRRCAQTVSKDPATVARWSSKNRWVSRVAAYDRYLDGIRRATMEEEARRMGERQAQHLQASGQALIAPVQALLKRIADLRQRAPEEDPFKGMTTGELARLAAMSARYVPGLVEAERLVRGLSTSNVADGAPATAEDARALAESKTRDELDDYLLGVDDGRRAMLAELGVVDDEPAAAAADGVPA